MELLIITVLIVLNGIFSMSEIVLVSSHKFKLDSDAEKGNKGGKKAPQLANNANAFLSTVQIGITLIGILTGIFSGKTITTDLAAALKEIPFLVAYADTGAMIIVVIATTYVFGELIPKRLGMAFPEKISSAVAQPMAIPSIGTDTPGSDGHGRATYQ